VPAGGEEDRGEAALTVTNATITRAIALALALLTTAAPGCGGSGDEPSGRKDGTQTRTASGRKDGTQTRTAQRNGTAGERETAFLTRANSACLQARVGATGPGAAHPTAPSRAARRVRAHARRSLPLATRTLAVLRALHPAGEPRQALVRLETEYERLFALYLDAAGPRRPGAKGLAEAVDMAEESVRAQARAARLPACSP
jgi:hypothetical protein